MKKWFDDAEMVADFGQVLIDFGDMENVNELQYYYTKPWKWDTEFNIWVEHQQPTEDEENWNDFVDAINNHRR